MIRKIFADHFFGRARYQRVWEKLHAVSLAGMNIGPSAEPAASGEAWVLDFIKPYLNGNACPVIFDVGANIGQYSLQVLNRFGPKLHLYTFEPSSQPYEILKFTLSDYKNAECLNFGFGEANEQKTLYSVAGHSGLSSVYDRRLFNEDVIAELSATKRYEQISVRTIDEFCLERGIERIDLLKIDVEGDELNVLKGAQSLISSGRVSCLQFEFGGANIDSRTYFRDLYLFLRDRYELYRIVRDGLAPITHYHEGLEIFVYANYLATLIKPAVRGSD